MGRTNRNEKREPEEKGYRVCVDGRWVFLSPGRIHKANKPQKQRKFKLVFA